MPCYEFTCQECGYTTTKLRKMEDRDEPISCGNQHHGEICGSTMIRVVALPSEPRFNAPDFTPKFYQ